MRDPNDFVVYEHWRPDRGECFYVGKGRRPRANLMCRRNIHHQNIQNKLQRMGLEVEIRLVATGLTEEEAFQFEIERIAFWQADGADLANKTSGGEGVSGLAWTESQREKIIAALRTRKRAPMSEEQKRHLSIINMGHKRTVIGRKLSAETKAKIGASKKGKPGPNKGKKLAPETIEKMKKTLSIVMAGENNPFFGRKHTEETKRKISEKKTGVKLGPRKP